LFNGFGKFASEEPNRENCIPNYLEKLVELCSLETAFEEAIQFANSKLQEEADSHQFIVGGSLSKVIEILQKCSLKPSESPSLDER